MFASWLVGQQPLWEKKHAVAAAAVAAAAVTKSAVAAAVALTPVLVGERILCEYIRTQHGFWDPGCTAGSRVQVLGPWVRVYLQRVRSPPEELWRVQHAAQQVEIALLYEHLAHQLCDLLAAQAHTAIHRQVLGQVANLEGRQQARLWGVGSRV